MAKSELEEQVLQGETDEGDFQSSTEEDSGDEDFGVSRKRASSSNKEEAPSSKKVKTTEVKKPAAKKAKAEKVVKKNYTDKEAGSILLNYINEQNKPFNANTIFENLHKEIKKPQVVKVLATLAKEGKIMEKEYGKSKVYYANQDQFPVVDETELKQMDDEITNLAEEAAELKTTLESLRSQIKELDSSMTNEALEKNIHELTEKNQQMEERLRVLEGSDTIDPKELDLLRTEITKYLKLWRKRRSQCKEMIGMIADGLDKKDQEVCEMIGIETEEELGLSLPFKR